MNYTFLELKPYRHSRETAQVFEEFLNTLPPPSKNNPFYKTHFKLILINQNKLIHFLIKVPSKQQSLIKEQLFSKYKNLEIIKTKFNIPTKFKWTNLKLNNSWVNLLKTHSQFNSNPLNSLLQSLSSNTILEIQFTPTQKNNLSDKCLKPLFKTKIRLGSPKMKQYSNLIETFNQYTLPHSNSLKPNLFSTNFILNSEELSTIFHLPNSDIHLGNLNYIQSKKLSTPPNLNSKNNIIAQSNYRNSQQKIGLNTEDRRKHTYIIGKTGMGKSTLVENLIISDLKAGRGLALIDPHGDLYQSLLQKIPKHRSNDLVLFDPFDHEFPISFNPLQEKKYKYLSISSLVTTFKKLFSHSWGPRLEYVLRNSLLTLAEYPSTSLLALPRLLTDEKYRLKLTSNLKDPILYKFWQNEFNNLAERQRQETVSPILNKIGQFFSSEICRNILSQSHNKLDLRFIMDSQKILLINLSKGQLGEDISQLLGSLLITKFQIDAMSRVDQNENQRKDFYLYIDEFQNFATESFINILSEARKYHLNLTIANQYLDQILPEIKDAIFGNIGNLLCFQLGSKDAQHLSQELSNQEEINQHDLQNLPKYHLYLRLLQNGILSKTFSATSLPPSSLPYLTAKSKNLIKLSRQRYSQEKQTVEKNILKWSNKKLS